jgi:hypothetical protein
VKKEKEKEKGCCIHRCHSVLAYRYASLRDQFSQRVLSFLKVHLSRFPRVKSTQFLACNFASIIRSNKVACKYILVRRKVVSKLADIREAFSMPPSAAGSAHLDASKLTSGTAPALKSKGNFVTGEMFPTQRSIKQDAEASSGQASSGQASLPGHLDNDPFVEVYKRRRVEHESSLQRPSQQPLARASFGSDAVKALFNSELPEVSSDQVQPNRIASMPLSIMATSSSPGVSRNITG